MRIAGTVLMGLLSLYQLVLILRAIFSWVQMLIPHWNPRGVFLVIAEGTYTLTDPPLRFLRKFIRPLRLGNIQLDMAFLVLFFLIILLMEVLGWVFA